MKNSFFILFLLILFLPSCEKSPKVIFDKEAYLKQGKQINLFENDSSLNFNEVFKIKKLQKNNFTSLNFKKILRKKNIKYSDVFLSNNYVFVIDKKSNLMKLDYNFKIINKVKIYKKIKDYNYKAYISLFSKNLIITDNLGNITSFNIEKLTINWNKKLTVPFVSRSVIYKNNIYALNINSKVFSFNLNNGDINWSYETASKIIKSSNAYSIYVKNETLLFSNDYAEIYSIDLSKKKLNWLIALQNKNLNLKNVNFEINTIKFYKSYIYISSNYGDLLALDFVTGKIVWAERTSVNSNLIFYKNKIIFYDLFEYLNIINIDNGKTEYKVKVNKNIKLNILKSNNKNLIYLDKQKINIFYPNNIIQVNINNLRETNLMKIKYSFINYLNNGSKILFLESQNLLFFNLEN